MKNLNPFLMGSLLMSLADELDLPVPPPVSASDSQDGEGMAIPEDVYASLPSVAEAIPVGIYPTRIKSFKKDRPKQKEGQAEDDFTDRAPYYNIQLTCTTEPHVGRVCFDMIPWVEDETMRAAGDPNSLDCKTARAELKKRLWKFKQLTAAAGYKGRMTFEAFAASEPEFKTDMGQKERRKDSGKVDSHGAKVYVATGEMDNKVNKYLPLT